MSSRRRSLAVRVGLVLLGALAVSGCNCDEEFVAHVCCIQGPIFEGQANRVTPDGILDLKECVNLCVNFAGKNYDYTDCRNVRVAFYLGPQGEHLPEWTGGLGGGGWGDDGIYYIPEGTPYYELDCVGIDHNTCNDAFAPQLSY